MTVINNTGNQIFLGANDFKKMILGANYFFDREKENINALNVFPVPDGDTGTNMSMTLYAAVEGSLKYDGESIGELSELIASRALMGARGNSGVILSQILRGIARGLRRKERITASELSKAFQYGVVYAYKAVSKPVEGTILTVAREMARGIRAAVRRGENLHTSIEEAISSGKTALAKTTEMLPALKEAGVVDAGGLGLLVFFEGCLYALKQSVSDIFFHKQHNPNAEEINISEKPVNHIAEKLDLQYPYCTEMIIKSESNYFTDLREILMPLGESLLVAIDKQLAKIHIHTAVPDQVLQTALNYGTLHEIKIENMVDQHEHFFNKTGSAEQPVIVPGMQKKESCKSGLIAVSFGEGFRDIFISLGADEVVFGGQTMNPKVEDLLEAVHRLPQNTIFILPNNNNIIMVAKQAQSITEKQVEVIETASLPEGLSALLAFNHERTDEENRTAMLKTISRVKTGLVTYATRDTVIRGLNVKSGHYLGLSGNQIISSNEGIYQAAFTLILNLIDENNEIITIFYGQDITEEEALKLTTAVKERFPELEVELQFGGQPIYYYIFSVE